LRSGGGTVGAADVVETCGNVQQFLLI
jgi:hypothetical protein